VLERATAEADRSHWEEIEAQVRQAEDLIGDFSAPELNSRIAQLRANSRLMSRLETVRVRRAGGANARQDMGFLDYAIADREYAGAFDDFGLAPQHSEIQQLTRFAADDAVRCQLAAALDDWAMVELAEGGRPKQSWKGLIILANGLDPDPVRIDIRSAVLRADKRSLVESARKSSSGAISPAAALLLTNALVQMGEPTLAFATLKSAQRQHPDDFWLNYMLAWHGQYQLGLDEVVLPYATAAVALRPQSPAANHLLGYVLLESERSEEAIVALRRAIQLNPGYAPPWLTLASALKSTRRFTEALDAADHAVSLAPGDRLFRRRRAEIQLAARKIHAATAELRELVKEDSSDWRAWKTLASCYFEQKDWRSAEDAARRALQITPDSGLYDQSARILLKLGKLSESEAARRESLRLRPDDTELYGRLANLLAARGKWGEAWKALRDGFETWWDVAVFYIHRGDAVFPRDKESALRYWRMALADRPDDKELRLKIVHALNDLGQVEQANIEAQQMRDAQSEKYWQTVRLGDDYAAKNQIEKAMTTYELARTFEPSGRTAELRLGELHARQGRSDEAVANFRDILKRDPRHKPAIAALGTELARRALATASQERTPSVDALKSAESDAREATTHAAESAATWRSLAAVHCRNDNAKEARAAIEKVGSLTTAYEALDLLLLARVEQLEMHDSAARAAYVRALKVIPDTQFSTATAFWRTKVESALAR
jgi:superkiller protein 3